MGPRLNVRGAGRRRGRGASLLEFALVAPLLLALGLLAVQWALVFHARNVANHAAFMAARAGATGHAQPDAIRDAYARALAPLHGGGRNLLQVEAAVVRAQADLAGHLRIEIVNPSAASFDDWADPGLQARLGAAGRALPNDGLALRDAADVARVGARSGQTLADANLLKLRITHGVEPRVPLAAAVVLAAARARDDGRDVFATDLLERGRLPMTFDVAVRMQSAAIESDATVGSARAPGGSADGAGCPDGRCPLRAVDPSPAPGTTPTPTPTPTSSRPPSAAPNPRATPPPASAPSTAARPSSASTPTTRVDPAPGDTVTGCRAGADCPFCPSRPSRP